MWQALCTIIRKTQFIADKRRFFTRENKVYQEKLRFFIENIFFYQKLCFQIEKLCLSLISIAYLEKTEFSKKYCSSKNESSSIDFVFAG